MIVTEKWIVEKYAYYNSKYWNGQLPKIYFYVNNSRKYWGLATYKYIANKYRTEIETIEPLSITLSNYYDSPEEVKETTLLHEMIHIADYFFHPEHFINISRTGKNRNYDAHGPEFFMKEANRLAADGWEIKRYITREAQSVSTLSDENKEKLEKRASKGYIACIADDKDKTKSGKWVMTTDKSKMEYFDNRFNTSSRNWLEKNFENAKWYECYCMEFVGKRKSLKDPSFNYYKEGTIESAMNSGKMKFLGDVIKKENTDETIPKKDKPIDFEHLYDILKNVKV